MNHRTMTHILNKWCNKYYVTRIFEYKDGVHIILYRNHWIVLYVENDIVDFFDSYGRSPIHFRIRLKNICVNNYLKYLQNKVMFVDIIVWLLYI